MKKATLRGVLLLGTATVHAGGYASVYVDPYAGEAALARANAAMIEVRASQAPAQGATQANEQILAALQNRHVAEQVATLDPAVRAIRSDAAEAVRITRAAPSSQENMIAYRNAIAAEQSAAALEKCVAAAKAAALNGDYTAVEKQINAAVGVGTSARAAIKAAYSHVVVPKR